MAFPVLVAPVEENKRRRKPKPFQFSKDLRTPSVETADSMDIKGLTEKDSFGKTLESAAS